MPRALHARQAFFAERFLAIFAEHIDFAVIFNANILLSYPWGALFTVFEVFRQNKPVFEGPRASQRHQEAQKNAGKKLQRFPDVTRKLCSSRGLPWHLSHVAMFFLIFTRKKQNMHPQSD